MSGYWILISPGIFIGWNQNYSRLPYFSNDCPSLIRELLAEPLLRRKFIQLFYPQNRPSLKNLEMSSFNSRPNSIRMHCPNCFSQMETRVEIVSRWFGPFAALWNKFLFFVVYSTFTLDLTKIGQWFWPIMHILELMDLITDTPVPIAITNFNKSSPLRVQYMLCTSIVFCFDFQNNLCCCKNKSV